MGHFGHIDRTHLGSTHPIRKLEVSNYEKNTRDLMFKDGDTTPPSHIGLIVKGKGSDISNDF